MYLNADTFIQLASFISAISALIGGIIVVYKVIDNNKKQSLEINSIKDEQTVICYALQGALQGLIEQGCNGPCKDALTILQKHLNTSAHKSDL